MTAEKMTLHKAMAKAFAQIEGATKGAENPGFKRDGKALKYADLLSVTEAIKPALIENGLFYLQITHEQQGGVCIETMLCHECGEQISLGKLFMPASKNDAQGYGSALSYCRRYSLMTAFGVCPEDDDGSAAVAAMAKPEKVQCISPAQEIELIDLAREVGADEAKFLKWCNVPSWSAIPAVNYMDARTALESKRKTTTPELDGDSVPHIGKD